MPAYLIATITVHDPGAFADYGRQVAPVVAAFGGRYLVRGGDTHALEGELGRKRLVVIEFPSMDAARRFYGDAEYAPLLRQRVGCTASEVALVEGTAPPG